MSISRIPVVYLKLSVYVCVYQYENIYRKCLEGYMSHCQKWLLAISRASGVRKGNAKL